MMGSSADCVHASACVRGQARAGGDRLVRGSLAVRHLVGGCQVRRRGVQAVVTGNTRPAKETERGMGAWWIWRR